MATLSVRIITKGVREATNNLKKLSKEAEKVSDIKFDVSPIVTATKGLLLAGAAFSAAFAVSFFEANKSLERSEVLLTGVTGSAYAGAEAMNYLVDMTTKAPFALDALTDSFTRLTIAGLDPMSGSLTTITNAIAAFGGNSEDLKLASIAIQQMAGKGVISMEELRRQLSERVPTAIRDMAEGLGMSYGAMVKMIGLGNLEATKGISAMLGVWETKFAGAGLKLMNTMQGAMSFIYAQWVALLRDMGKMGVWDELVDSAKDIGFYLKDLRVDPDFIESLQKMSDVIVKTISDFREWIDINDILVNGSFEQWAKEASVVIKLVGKAALFSLESISIFAMYIEALSRDDISLLEWGMTDHTDIGALLAKSDARRLAIKNEKAEYEEYLKVLSIRFELSVHEYNYDKDQKAIQAVKKEISSLIDLLSEAEDASSKSFYIAAIDELKNKLTSLTDIDVGFELNMPDVSSFDNLTEGIIGYAEQIDNLSIAHLKATKIKHELTEDDKIEITLLNEQLKIRDNIKATAAGIVDFDEAIFDALQKSNDLIEDELLESLNEVSNVFSEIDTETYLANLTGMDKYYTNIRLEAEKMKLEDSFSSTPLIEIEEKLKQLYAAQGKYTEALILSKRESGNLWEGFVAGAMEANEELLKLGELGYQIFGDFKAGLKDSFVAIFKGQFDEIGDIWSNTLDSMLNNVIDWAAEAATNMVIEAGMGFVNDMLGTNFSTGIQSYHGGAADVYVTNMSGAVSSTGGGVIDGATDIWNGIKNLFGSADTLSTMFDDTPGSWDSVATGIADSMDASLSGAWWNSDTSSIWDNAINSGSSAWDTSSSLYGGTAASDNFWSTASDYMWSDSDINAFWTTGGTAIERSFDNFSFAEDIDKVFSTFSDTEFDVIMSRIDAIPTAETATFGEKVSSYYAMAEPYMAMGAGAFGVYSGIQGIEEGNYIGGAAQTIGGASNIYSGAISADLIEGTAALNSAVGLVGNAVGVVGGAYGLYNSITDMASNGLSEQNIIGTAAAAMNTYTAAQAGYAAYTAGTSVGAASTGMGLASSLSAASIIGGVVAGIHMMGGLDSDDAKYSYDIPSGSTSYAIKVGEEPSSQMIYDKLGRNREVSNDIYDTRYAGYDEDERAGVDDLHIEMMKDDLAASMQAFEVLSIYFNDQFATMVMNLEPTVEAFDGFIESISGLTITTEQAAEAHLLAQKAAVGDVYALHDLTEMLELFGLSSVDAGLAAEGMASTMYEAFRGMGLSLEDFVGLVGSQANLLGSISVTGNTEAPSTSTSFFGTSWNAEGGIANNPLIFQGIGEAGPEAIVPLHNGPDTLRKMDDKIDALANKVQNIFINIAGHEVQHVIDPMVDAHIVSRGVAGVTETQRVAY